MTLPRVDCKGKDTWHHGSSLINYMKLASFNGLSGKVREEVTHTHTHKKKTRTDICSLTCGGHGIQRPDNLSTFD